jgi:hypothetical protein
MAHETTGDVNRDMYADARAARRNLRLERIARAVVEPPPSLRYDDYPREVAKREIRVDEAAQRIANALHLHLD